MVNTQKSPSIPSPVPLQYWDERWRGYHCAKFFKKRGDGVLGLDNFNPYYPVAGCELLGELWLKWLKWIEMDVIY